MFCPKCGSQNAENVRFCRSCGLELESVSAVMTGKLSLRRNVEDVNCNGENSNDPDKLWNVAVTSFLVGVAFLIVSIVLAVSGAAGGRNWWFWMLIPAFWQMGSGVASYLKVKRIEQRANYAGFNSGNAAFPPQGTNAALPPRRTLFANDYAAPAARNTEELFAPPTSVTENTTTHLKINTEGETINLPNQK
ncbi:MAG TPA: zinc-ribbon domain-containing protein [Pyrinomonadaceae bacterium]|nr:zinc-ribbon domain-containing protein [Pyrinomonadaceae bacterium]